MSKEALVIVDVQKDFCPKGALPVPEGDLVVEPLNRMINLALRKGWHIVASKDSHPSNTSHFDKWPRHCVIGTPGERFHPALHLIDALVFSKGTRKDEDAYSAFDGRAAQKQDGSPLLLEEFLKTESVTKLYIGGLATDYCVKATALDAVKKGFEAYLLLDAVAAVNLKPDDGDEAIKEMVVAGVRMATVDLVLQKYLGTGYQ